MTDLLLSPTAQRCKPASVEEPFESYLHRHGVAAWFTAIAAATAPPSSARPPSPSQLSSVGVAPTAARSKQHQKQPQATRQPSTSGGTQQAVAPLVAQFAHAFQWLQLRRFGLGPRRSVAVGLLQRHPSVPSPSSDLAASVTASCASYFAVPALAASPESSEAPAKGGAVDGAAAASKTGSGVPLPTGPMATPYQRTLIVADVSPAEGPAVLERRIAYVAATIRSLIALNQRIMLLPLLCGEGMVRPDIYRTGRGDDGESPATKAAEFIHAVLADVKDVICTFGAPQSLSFVELAVGDIAFTGIGSSTATGSSSSCLAREFPPYCGGSNALTAAADGPMWPYNCVVVLPALPATCRDERLGNAALIAAYAPYVDVVVCDAVSALPQRRASLQGLPRAVGGGSLLGCAATAEINALGVLLAGPPPEKTLPLATRRRVLLLGDLPYRPSAAIEPQADSCGLLACLRQCGLRGASPQQAADHLASLFDDVVFLGWNAVAYRKWCSTGKTSSDATASVATDAAAPATSHHTTPLGATAPAAVVTSSTSFALWEAAKPASAATAAVAVEASASMAAERSASGAALVSEHTMTPSQSHDVTMFQAFVAALRRRGTELVATEDLVISRRPSQRALGLSQAAASTLGLSPSRRRQTASPHRRSVSPPLLGLAASSQKGGGAAAASSPQSKNKPGASADRRTAHVVGYVEPPRLTDDHVMSGVGPKTQAAIAALVAGAQLVAAVGECTHPNFDIAPDGVVAALQAALPREAWFVAAGNGPARCAAHLVAPSSSRPTRRTENPSAAGAAAGSLGFEWYQRCSTVCTPVADVMQMLCGVPMEQLADLATA